METTTKIEPTAEDILRQTKLYAIEDIFKVKKLLYGFGQHQHLAAITSPADVFDELYELELYELEELNKNLSADASRIAWSLTNKL